MLKKKLKRNSTQDLSYFQDLNFEGNFFSFGFDFIAQLECGKKIYR